MLAFDRCGVVLGDDLGSFQFGSRGDAIETLGCDDQYSYQLRAQATNFFVHGSLSNAAASPRRVKKLEELSIWIVGVFIEMVLV